MKQNVLIRCDASKEIGLGHVTRCLVLAQQFKKDSNKVFFAIRENEIAMKKLQESGFQYFLPSSNDYNSWLQNITDTQNINIFIGDVRDGLAKKTIQEFKQKGILCVAIDEPSEYAKECDLCFYPPHAQIDVNQYKGKVYQGFEYVLLRDEFYKTYQKRYNKKPHILVMMGGTDAHNLSYKVVQQLLNTNFNGKISVVINQNHPDFTKLSVLSENVKIDSNIDDMAIFLTQIDFAIITFGVTAYELVAMQVPSYHICLDDDHYSASKFFEKNGYAKCLNKIDIGDLKDINLSILQKNTITNIVLKTILTHL